MLYPVEAAAGYESLMENIIHHHLRHYHDGESLSSSSSSSSSSSCSSSPRDSSSSNINQQQLKIKMKKKKKKKKRKKKKDRFFRNKPLHKILGGGKSADIILWRDKRMSACMLAGVTVLWFLFEWQGYHLVSFSCHFLILSMVILFLCSNLSSFLNRSPPKFQEAIIVPEDLFVSFALSLRYELYQAFAIFREVATGKNLKKFLRAVVVLWVLSVVGSWFNFLTLLYIAFVILQTVAVLYEKHEGQVDTWAEKVMVEINKHYTLLEEKVRQKLAKTKQQ